MFLYKKKKDHVRTKLQESSIQVFEYISQVNTIRNQQYLERFKKQKERKKIWRVLKDKGKKGGFKQIR